MKQFIKTSVKNVSFVLFFGVLFSLLTWHENKAAFEMMMTGEEISESKKVTKEEVIISWYNGKRDTTIIYHPVKK